MDNLKKNAGKEAAGLIKDGMVVGIGTGSTTDCFINSLAERCRQGLKIKGIATSQASMKRAIKNDIPIIDINKNPIIDITIDGADEIDDNKNLIKGRGGALLREKIVASNSKQMIVIADESKLVTKLGQKILPVEVVHFGHLKTLTKINDIGYESTLRMKNNQPYITDSGNLIIDISLNGKCRDAQELHQKIIDIPGVIETGFFFSIASKIIVGTQEGVKVI